MCAAKPVLSQHLWRFDVNMRVAAFVFVLTALLAVALAAGQYYVPRAYYTIDQQGHESIPVPLRRLRRSWQPHPEPQPDPYPGSWSNSASGASAWSNSGSGSGGNGGWYPRPASGGYGATAPNLTFNRGVSGTFNARNGALGTGPLGSGHYVSSSSSIGVDSSGQGHYDSGVSAGNYP